MAKLDLQYIASLVDAAQAGDSNAFAELYLATYQKQYDFSYQYLKDEHMAHDALQQTYVNALKNLYSLPDSNIFIPWLYQINFKVCFNKKEKTALNGDPENRTAIIDGNVYSVKQLLNLPPSESRAIIMCYYHDMDVREIAKLMDCKPGAVKQYLKEGRRRLRELRQS